MKIRKGFVSNSSSSSFILDKSVPQVQELLSNLPQNINMGATGCYDLSRATTLMNSEQAVEFAEKLNEEYKNYGGLDIANAILKFHRLLGDNLVHLRESDEGMGGYLFYHIESDKERDRLHQILESNALWQGEYH